MSKQKSIEELKDEFFDSVGHCISTQSPQNFTNVKNKFTQILQSERDRAEEEKREVYRNLSCWVNCNIGLSSKSIFLFMATGQVPTSFAAPSDGGDRDRCVVLLQAVPQWIERLSELEALEIPRWNEQIQLIREALNNPQDK